MEHSDLQALECRSQKRRISSLLEIREGGRKLLKGDGGEGDAGEAAGFSPVPALVLVFIIC